MVQEVVFGAGRCNIYTLLIFIRIRIRIFLSIFTFYIY